MRIRLFFFIKYFLLLYLLCTAIFISACSTTSIKFPGSDHAVSVKIKSVPLKIALAAGEAALKVASEEFLGVEIDTKDLMQQIAPGEVATGLPPTNEPVLMVVNKKTNDILFWKLTDQVHMIRLKHDSPGVQLS